ncbi:helix-turn-helix transcriptional regulator [Staphylococcus saprophyticus]|nr:helix-turn-helix transcriptional regulator [Staphylococcus saprophyticus]
MNQSDLCRKVPIERSYFSRIINGKTLPSEIMAIKIANTLNVDVSEIFEMKEKV